MSKDNITEDAAGGSTGASSIAVNPSAGHAHEPLRRSTGSDRHAEHDWRSTVAKDKEQKAKSAHIQDQLRRAQELKKKREEEGKKKRGSFSSFFRRKVNEEFDMGSIVSQLKGIEGSSSDSVSAAVSYGIEDDKGNFMRVTVKSDQAKEFEMTIARKMADNKDNTVLGLNTQKMSLAEILFDLQNQFDILDVEFPIIPKDAVYNQDDATVGQPNQPADNQNVVPDANGQFGEDATGMDAFDGNDPNATGGDLGGLGDDNTANTSDLGSGETNPDDVLGTGQPDETDADNVEDFGTETTSDTDPASLLRSLVDMLKKQAEAETAKANASAEQARASQAEWSAIAANKEVERQEEFARVQADLDEKKRREKQAKQYADLAKYNVTQGKSALNNMDEGIEDSFLYSSILEDATQINNVAALQQAKQEIIEKYKPNSNDSTLDKNYKTAAMRLEMAQLNNRIDFIKLTDQYNKQKTLQDQSQQGQNNDNQNQNNQNNNQQNNNNPNNNVVQNNAPQNQSATQGQNGNANQQGSIGI
jgi:hypothetical protein